MIEKDRYAGSQGQKTRDGHQLERNQGDFRSSRKDQR